MREHFSEAQIGVLTAMVAILPKSILRTLSETEMAAYRQPFGTPEARLPTLVWPREPPISGEPAEVTEIVESYGQWLAKTDIPKLLVSAEPGALLTGRALAVCRSWPNQQEVSVKGIHYVQEDSPAEIGIGLQHFVRGLDGMAC